VFEIGNSLREARLRQRLDFAELEQAVKVRAKYLRALEDEHFDLLPEPAYVKGFLRAYASFLGLDGQLYVDEYSSRFVADEEQRPLRARRSSAAPRRHRRLERRILALGLGGIVVAAVLVFVAFRFGGTSPEQTSVANLTGKRGAPARATAAAHATVPLARLVATAARGPVWIEVHVGTATGRLLYQGTLERGRTLPFSARKLWLSVRTPTNLRLRLNGKLVPRVWGKAPRVLVASPRGVTRG
jgi:hypothetical protein